MWRASSGWQLEALLASSAAFSLDALAFVHSKDIQCFCQKEESKFPLKEKGYKDINAGEQTPASYSADDLLAHETFW